MIGGVLFGLVMGGMLIATCYIHEKDYEQLIKWKKERRERRVQ